VVNTAEAAIDAAIANAGIARVLSYQVETAVRAGSLALILDDFEPAPLPVSLVHIGHGLLPAKLRAFLDSAAAAPEGADSEIGWIDRLRQTVSTTLT
jgi:DNA-binding transcriptional LysR family regulator